MPDGCTQDKKGKADGTVSCPISEVLNNHCGQGPPSEQRAYVYSKKYPAICKLIEMNRKEYVSYVDDTL